MHKNPIFWSLLADVLRFGYAIILMPIVLIVFTPNDVVLWLTFIMLAGAIPIFDMGLTHTIQRMSAYVYAGASEINAQELPKSGSKIDLGLLASLLKGSQRLYLIITILAALSFYTIGSIYVLSIAKEPDNYHNVFLWCLYITGFLINFYFSYTVSIIFGRGDIISASKVQIIFGVLYMFLAICFIFFGYTLDGICYSVLIASLVSRSYAYKKLYGCPEIKKTLKMPVGNIGIKEFIDKIKGNAIKYGLVSLSIFMVSRVPSLLVVYFFGADKASGLTFSIYVFSLLGIISLIPFTISMPKMNEFAVRFGITRVKPVFQLSWCVVLMTYLIASCLVILFGPFILEAINSSINFVSLPYLCILALTGFLEANHAVCANVLTVQNKIPFYKQSLLTGVIIIIFIFIGYNEGLSIEQLIVVPFLIQLAFNNWYWPLQASKLFKIGYFDLLKESFLISYRFIRSKCSVTRYLLIVEVSRLTLFLG